MTLPVRLVSGLLVAPILVLSVAIIVKGYASVGDGFSAGVVASLALVLKRIAYEPAAERREIAWRAPVALLLGGLAVALGTGFVPAVLGNPVFAHAPGPGEKVAKVGTLELATPFLFDLGVAAVIVGTVLVGFGLLDGERERGNE